MLYSASSFTFTDGPAYCTEQSRAYSDTPPHPHPHVNGVLTSLGHKSQRQLETGSGQQAQAAAAQPATLSKCTINPLKQ